MLSEEAFILVVVCGACALLVLGVLELLWPTSPRRARRAASPALPPPDDELIRPVRPLIPVTPLRRPVEAIPFPFPFRSVTRPSDDPPVEDAPPRELLEPVVLEELPADDPPLEVLPLEILSPESEPLEIPPSEPAPRAVIALPAEAPLEEALPPEAPPAEASPVDAPLAEASPAEAPPAVDFPPPLPEIVRPVEAPPVETPPPRRLRRSKVSPHARQHRVLRARKTYGDEFTPPIAPERAPARRVEVAPRESFWTTAGLPEPTAETRVGRDSPLVETCFAMYQEKRFGEVVVRAEEALAEVPAEVPASLAHETAALWAVLALAKQALGDDEGAGAALGSALEIAPESERATYRRHFATLTLDAARVRLTRAQGHDTGDRVETIRAAIAWIERGLAVVPDDAALADAREAAHEALWSAYEQAATALLQRQEFHGARLLLREPLTDPALPAARAEALNALVAGTFGGEVGQLTAHAIRCLQESREPDALESLRRAEDLLATIPPEALPAKRRDEVDQRLWWGYTELGKRRVAAGDPERALESLGHALQFESIGPDRQAETRAALVQALEGIASARARSIRRLGEARHPDEAAARAEALRALLQSYLDLGLTEDELATPMAETRRLCAELGIDEPA